MLLYFRLDAGVGIVFDLHVWPRDIQKRYRFTPPVSKWRICEALSVDVLCGFGAKNFNHCADSNSRQFLRGVSGRWFVGHFRVFCGALVLYWCGFAGNVSTRGAHVPFVDPWAA